MSRILVTDKTHPVLQQTLEATGHAVVVDTTVTYDSLLEQIGQYDALDRAIRRAGGAQQD